MHYIIVAHLDDEILFFNSLIQNNIKIIVIFHESADESITKQRKRIRGKLPYKHITFLDIKEADVYRAADFKKGQIITEGIKVNRNQDKYNKNFKVIQDYIRSNITANDTIYTHNPWGEYGHEEHIQVFNAVYAQLSIGLNLLTSSYYSNKSFTLMLKRLNEITIKECQAFQTDEAL